MSTANPEKAVRAILPVPIQCKCGCTVRPVTLGVFAVLERIRSPLLGETPVDGPLSLIPSLYALTHDPADSLAPNLYERSLEWADTLPPSALAEIRDAAERQCAAMLDVVPQSAASKKRPQRMDRHPRRMGGARVRVDVGRDPLARPRERNRPPQEAAPRGGRNRLRLHAKRDREDRCPRSSP